MKLPQAQSESLITRWVDGELIIIDEATHAVHCLSDPAARVFMQCTGKHTPEQIADAESLGLGQVTDVLEKLADAGLLLSAPSKLDLTRRAFTGRTLRATALAAGAAPIITSLLLPAAAHASPLACSQVACTGQGSGTSKSLPAARELADQQARSRANAVCSNEHPAACGTSASCSGAFHSSSHRMVSAQKTVVKGKYSGHCASS